MPIEIIVQLLPALLSSITTLLTTAKQQNAANATAEVASILTDIEQSVQTLTQAQALVTTLQAQGNRAPTTEEWAPFKAAFLADDQALSTAIAAALAAAKSAP